MITSYNITQHPIFWDVEQNSYGVKRSRRIGLLNFYLALRLLMATSCRWDLLLFDNVDGHLNRRPTIHPHVIILRNTLFN